MFRELSSLAAVTRSAAAPTIPLQPTGLGAFGTAGAHCSLGGQDASGVGVDASRHKIWVVVRSAGKRVRPRGPQVSMRLRRATSTFGRRENKPRSISTWRPGSSVQPRRNVLRTRYGLGRLHAIAMRCRTNMQDYRSPMLFPGFWTRCSPADSRHPCSKEVPRQGAL